MIFFISVEMFVICKSIKSQKVEIFLYLAVVLEQFGEGGPLLVLGHGSVWSVKLGEVRREEEDGGSQEQRLQLLETPGNIFSHGPSLEYFPPGSDPLGAGVGRVNKRNRTNT